MRLSFRIPLFWRTRFKMQEDEETTPLIPKGDIDKEMKTLGIGEDSEELSNSKLQLIHHESQREYSPKDPRNISLCTYLLKYLLFFSNFCFSVLGLVTLGLGMWGLVDKESFAQEKIGYIGTDPMLLFVSLGAILSLLCLSGCVGTIRENVCLLRVFSAGLLALVAFQMLVAIVAYTLRGQVESYLRSGMLTAMVRYQDDLDFRFITDEIQIGLQCCGADSYQDWEVNIYFNCSAPGVQACSVPPSCCVDPLENGTVWNSQCGVGARRLPEFSAQSVVFLGGCLGGMSRWIDQHAKLIGAAGSILLGVQIVSVFVSVHLLEDIRKNQVK